MDRSGKLYRLELVEGDGTTEVTSVYWLPEHRYALLRTALGDPDIYTLGADR